MSATKVILAVSKVLHKIVRTLKRLSFLRPFILLGELGEVFSPNPLQGAIYLNGPQTHDNRFGQFDRIFPDTRRHHQHKPRKLAVFPAHWPRHTSFRLEDIK